MNADLTDFKPTFVPWYEVSFREKTRRMTPVQRMFYRNLLMESYWGDQRPALTSDDNELWELADAESLEQWLQNKEAVLKHFFTVTLEDGTVVLKNKRVQEEWSRMIGLLEKKSNAGKASAAARQARVAGQKNPPAPPRKQNRTGHNTTSTSHKSVERCSTGDDRCSTDVEEAGAAGAEREPLPSVSEESAIGLENLQKITKEYLDRYSRQAKNDVDSVARLEKQFGRETVALTYRFFLDEGRNSETLDGKPIEYLISEFARRAETQITAKELKPLVDQGFRSVSIVRFVQEMCIPEEALELTPEEVKWFEDVYDSRLEKKYCDFWEKRHGTLKEFVLCERQAAQTTGATA